MQQDPPARTIDFMMQQLFTFVVSCCIEHGRVMGLQNALLCSHMHYF